LRQALIDDGDELDSVDSLRLLRLHVRDEVGLLQHHRRVTNGLHELLRRDIRLVERGDELRELILRDSGDTRDRIDGERHGYEREEIVRVQRARAGWDEREDDEQKGELSHARYLCKEGTGFTRRRGEAERSGFLCSPPLSDLRVKPFLVQSRGSRYGMRRLSILALLLFPLIANAQPYPVGGDVKAPVVIVHVNPI